MLAWLSQITSSPNRATARSRCRRRWVSDRAPASSSWSRCVSGSRIGKKSALSSVEPKITVRVDRGLALVGRDLVVQIGLGPTNPQGDDDVALTPCGRAGFVRGYSPAPCGRSVGEQLERMRASAARWRLPSAARLSDMMRRPASSGFISEFSIVRVALLPSAWRSSRWFTTLSHWSALRGAPKPLPPGPVRKHALLGTLSIGTNRSWIIRRPPLRWAPAPR